MDGESQMGIHPGEPEDQQPEAPGWPQPADQDAGTGPAPQYLYSPTGAPEPPPGGFSPPYPGVQPPQWSTQAPPSGYGTAYPGVPNAQPSHPGQVGLRSQGWSPPGYPVQLGYGWTTASGTPYEYTPGGALPMPTARKRLPTVAIIGLVALMMVVSIAGAMGLLVTLGPRLTTGGVGLFAHQRTVEPTPMTYAYDFKDSLNGAINVGWSTNRGCSFEGGAYHVNPGSNYGGVLCPAPVEALFDLDMRVTASEVAGPLNYGYGLALRYESTGSFYLFVIDSDGQPWFATLSAWKVTHRTYLWNPTNFARGLNAHNTLRVVARGSSFTFYVNGEQIGQATDSTYINGTVGLVSGENNLDAAFTNFELHGNP